MSTLFLTAIGDGIHAVNRTWQLVLVQLMFTMFSFTSFFIIVGVPVAVAFIIFGLDLTDVLRHDVLSILRQSADLFRKYFTMAVLIILSIVVYLFFVIVVWVFTLGGTVGTLAGAIRDSGARFGTRAFIAEGGRLFFPLLLFTSVVGILFGVLGAWAARVLLLNDLNLGMALGTGAAVPSLQIDHPGPHMLQWAARANMIEPGSSGDKMNANSSSRLTLLKAALLFMGSAAFAFCFCAFLHEGGHLIIYESVGIPRTGISLHPFGWNYNLSVNEDGTFWHVSPEDENADLISAINGGSGSIFNLLVGVPIGLFFWKKRSPALLPLLMIGCWALLIEGYPMLEQAFGGGGDWYQVINGVGIPKALVVLLGAICFAGGCIWMLQLLTVAGISTQDPFGHRLVVLLAGLPLFISGTVFYQLLFGVDLFVPSWDQYVTVSYIVSSTSSR